MSINDDTENPQNSPQEENDNAQSIQPDTAEEQASAEQSPKFGHGLKKKTLWDWLDLLIAPGIITIGASLLTLSLQNFDNSKKEANRYNQQLVKEYTDSVQVLFVDQYYFKNSEYQETIPKEVGGFIKSYTGNTIQALKGDFQQTSRIIDFLRSLEIGFTSGFKIKPSEICDQEFDKKDGKYSGFLCGINLERANLKGINLNQGILGEAILSQANLSGANLESSYLRKAYLVKANLKNASLVSADLTEADLRGVNLTKANLDIANLRGSNLESFIEQDPFTNKQTQLKATLKETLLIKANLREANLTGVDLTGANLTRANLRGANLKDTLITHKTIFENALYDFSTQLPFNDEIAKEKNMIKIAPLSNFSETNLRGADLIDANLTGANLTKADLTEADITGANLRGANLRGANLRGANLLGIIYDENTKFTNALFDAESWLPFRQDEIYEIGLLEIASKADLRGADLRGADLKRTELTKANLREANLTGANLEGADLTRADLRGAYLKGIFFDNQTKLQYALFDSDTQLPFSKEEAKSKEILEIVAGADLTGTDLSGADLSGADLKDAVLQRVYLAGADLTRADLRGADLTRADLRGANLAEIIFDDETEFKDALFGLFKPENPKFITQLPFDKEVAREKQLLEIAPTADLISADLRQVDLKDADLRDANLTGANLVGADLTKADLRGADLTDVIYNIQTKFDNALFDSSTQLPFEKKYTRGEKMWEIVPGANLTGADLTGADLTGTDLTGADLTGADLTDANLIDANLTGANLIDANLQDEQLKQTKLLCGTIDPLGKVLRANCPSGN